MQKYYRLLNRPMPWGDYGEILFSGCNSRDKGTGQFYIQRTAPFVPGIWRDSRFAWLFVTDMMKEKLEDAALSGLTFHPAIKDKIVSLAWETWDLSAPEPKIYPSGDRDAEEYITRRKHSEPLSQEMGNIWAITPVAQGLESMRLPVSLAQVPGNTDLFTPEYHRTRFENIYVSERAKDWLTTCGNGHVCFEPVPLTEISAQELEKIHAQMARNKQVAAKSAAMTHEKWRLWHRLTGQAEKLAVERRTAKSEAIKIRRREKAIVKFKEAEEMYPLLGGYDKILQELLAEQEASIHAPVSDAR